MSQGGDLFCCDIRELLTKVMKCHTTSKKKTRSVSLSFPPFQPFLSSGYLSSFCFFFKKRLHSMPCHVFPSWDIIGWVILLFFAKLVMVRQCTGWPNAFFVITDPQRAPFQGKWFPSFFLADTAAHHAPRLPQLQVGTGSTAASLRGQGNWLQEEPPQHQLSLDPFTPLFTLLTLHCCNAVTMLLQYAREYWKWKGRIYILHWMEFSNVDRNHLVGLLSAFSQ